MLCSARWAWPYWPSSPVCDLVYDGVLGAGGDGGRVRRAQRLWSDRLTLGVQVPTQQQPQLLVFLSEVFFVLPQSFSPQHGAVEPPQQLLQLRGLARHLEDGGQRSGGGFLLLWRLEHQQVAVGVWTKLTGASTI